MTNYVTSETKIPLPVNKISPQLLLKDAARKILKLVCRFIRSYSGKAYNLQRIFCHN